MRYCLFLSVALLALGCNDPNDRLNTPPHGQPLQDEDGRAKVSDLQGTFVYMADNALLANMTVSDMHFLPHRAQLNTVGRERVARLASLMDAYGGTIRFNSDDRDEALRRDRLDAVLECLMEMGCYATTETIREDLPGGAGIDATEAVLIKAHEATYTPNKGGAARQSSSTSIRGTP
jgi:hypothetical protein